MQFCKWLDRHKTFTQRHMSNFQPPNRWCDMLLKCLLKPDFRINFRVESIIKTGWFMILILGHALYDLAAIAIRKSRHITGHFPLTLGPSCQPSQRL